MNLQENVGLLLDSRAYTAPHLFANMASGGKFKLYPHVEYIGNKIQAAIAARNARLIICVPPRHSKSWLSSYWTPAWALETFPDWNIIMASYGQQLASRWGRRVRNEITRNPAFTVKLEQDSQAANLFHTSADGAFLATGVDGAATGFGGNLVLVDDPHKNFKEASSRVVRESVHHWFDEDIYSRLEPGGSVIVLMQRMHDNDLVGHLLANHADDNWELIRLPAIAEQGDPLGRTAGEALCPERYDVEALGRIKRAVGAYAWDARYQQAPQSQVAGAVYRNFREATAPAGNIDAAIVLHKHLPLHLSVDFNSNPGMHGIIGQHDPVTDRFTAAYELTGPRMTVTEMVTEFGRWIVAQGGWQWPELHVFGDATGQAAPTARDDSQYELVRVSVAALKMPIPLRLRVARSNPRVSSRLTAFNEALLTVEGDRRYFVHPRCVTLLRDFRELKADQYGQEDKSDQLLSHASSAEGYRVHMIRPMRQPLEIPQGRFGVRVAR